ncbi:MAG: GIY-YIG nuclease family protein [Planctomycetota bacterium]
MKYFVYILESLTDNKFYIGFTNNLKRRFKEHNMGLVRSTKPRKPFKLLYSESFGTKEQALEREKVFKSHKNHSYIEKLIQKCIPISSK